ncbi:MAG: hypothetical protein J7K83_00635 [Candidatus Aenigmarchaeota archaeon]|nr:hypothetical protein [Candidatus Aenigmarchaeota archaeon]
MRYGISDISMRLKRLQAMYRKGLITHKQLKNELLKLYRIASKPRTYKLLLPKSPQARNKLRKAIRRWLSKL